MVAPDKSYAIEQRLNALIAQGADTGWHNFGTMSASWTNSVARYRAVGMGLIFLEFRGVVPGTTTNGTVIWTAGNGLAAISGYLPASVRRIIFGNAGTAGANPPELEFETDGSVQCFNVVAGVTGMDANVLLSVI